MVNPECQPELFADDCQSVLDPERKLASLHRESAHPQWRDRYSPMVEDIKYNNLKLRNIIGLPIARGKDPHVGDRFYKFLVKRVVKYDAFRIFTEYDGLEHDEPTDVDARINQVKALVGEVLDNKIHLNEKYNKYHEFEKAYREEWKIDPHLDFPKRYINPRKVKINQV